MSKWELHSRADSAALPMTKKLSKRMTGKQTAEQSAENNQSSVQMSISSKTSKKLMQFFVTIDSNCDNNTIIQNLSFVMTLITILEFLKLAFDKFQNVFMH